MAISQCPSSSDIESVHAGLSGGSADVQQWVRGEEPETLAGKSRAATTNPGVHRNLNAVFAVTDRPSAECAVRVADVEGSLAGPRAVFQNHNFVDNYVAAKRIEQVARHRGQAVGSVGGASEDSVVAAHPVVDNQAVMEVPAVMTPVEEEAAAQVAAWEESSRVLLDSVMTSR